MQRKEIAISNPTMVADFFKNAPTAVFTGVNVEFNLELAKLRIHIKGEGFRSSLTPSVMKGFMALQDMIYRQYSLKHVD